MSLVHMLMAAEDKFRRADFSIYRAGNTIHWRGWTTGLQCFDTVGWVAGRASGLQKNEWWGAGMVICLE